MTDIQIDTNTAIIDNNRPCLTHSMQPKKFMINTCNITPISEILFSNFLCWMVFNSTISFY